LQGNRTVRKFICKRCEKPSKDLQGGFSQWSQKHQAELIYENIDLCDKCFKITRNEEKNLKYLQEAMSKGLIKEGDIETLKRFQMEKPFRTEILEKLGYIKRKGVTPVGEKHPPSHYRRLERRKRERDGGKKE
jgi:hypothetical protein